MNKLSYPVSRGAGMVLAAAIVFLWDTQSDSVLHGLVLPIGLAGAAWLTTRSLMAVAFATFTLAAINSNFTSAGWIAGLAYPLLAFVGLVVCIVIAARRFRARIAETHTQRWEQRLARRGHPQDKGHAEQCP